MFGVARLTDGTGAYYLADMATELGPFAARGGEAGPDGPGRWVGRAASGLGLCGSVDREVLGRVLSGCSPTSGRSLVVRPGPVRGYDLTVSAPKSVSLLFALGASPVAAEVLGAHEEAVGEAIGYVERRALAVRRGSGEDRHLLPTGGLTGARFTHGVSRALDPHLHSHVVVANLGHGTDGRWSALDGRGLFAHARAAGALYEAQLRYRLSERLGVEWVVRDGQHRVDGIDPVVLGGFALRGAEIRAHLAERSFSSRRAGRVAWAATRDQKDPALDATGVKGRWAERAAALGLDPGGLSAILDRPLDPLVGIDEHRFAASLLTNGQPEVSRRNVVRAWSGALGRGAPAEEIERCVDRLLPSETGVGVAEPGHAPAAVVPSAAALRLLGARPTSGHQLGHWQEAAAGIARYSTRWGHDAAADLGRECGGAELAGLPARRLADRLALSRSVQEVRRRLGRDPGREPDRLARHRSRD